MRTNCVVAPAVFAAGLLATAHAQVLAPEEIRDPQLRALQEKYRNELKLIPQILAAHEFPYKFYFSRRLDVAEKDQPRNDQRSVQFDRYKGKVVLKITGNYFVSYSAELMKPEERARETYQEVMLPLLRACMRALAHADAPQAFAFEISHHVRRRVLGIWSEAAENVVLTLPKASAERMLNSDDPKVQEAALFDAEVFLNAVPVSLWPGGSRDAGDLVAGERTASPAASGSAVSTYGWRQRCQASNCAPRSHCVDPAPPGHHDSRIGREDEGGAGYFPTGPQRFAEVLSIRAGQNASGPRGAG